MSPIKCAGMPWNCLQHFTQLLKSFLSLIKSLKLVKDHMHLCDLGKDGCYQNRPCLKIHIYSTFCLATWVTISTYKPFNQSSKDSTTVMCITICTPAVNSSLFYLTKTKDIIILINCFTY